MPLDTNTYLYSRTRACILSENMNIGLNYGANNQYFDQKMKPWMAPHSLVKSTRTWITTHLMFNSIIKTCFPNQKDTTPTVPYFTESVYEIRHVPDAHFVRYEFDELARFFIPPTKPTFHSIHRYVHKDVIHVKFDFKLYCLAKPVHDISQIRCVFQGSKPRKRKKNQW